MSCPACPRLQFACAASGFVVRVTISFLISASIRNVLLHTDGITRRITRYSIANYTVHVLGVVPEDAHIAAQIKQCAMAVRRPHWHVRLGAGALAFTGTTTTTPSTSALPSLRDCRFQRRCIHSFSLPLRSLLCGRRRLSPCQRSYGYRHLIPDVPQIILHAQQISQPLWIDVLQRTQCVCTLSIPRPPSS